MTRIIKFVNAKRWPTTGNSLDLETSIKNRRLNGWAGRVEVLEITGGPPYLAEPPDMEGITRIELLI
jgi:hypothetical protein